MKESALLEPRASGNERHNQNEIRNADTEYAYQILVVLSTHDSYLQLEILGPFTDDVLAHKKASYPGLERHNATGRAIIPTVFGKVIQYIHTIQGKL